MSKRSSHPHADERVASSAASLPLWTGAPEIRTPAPVAPGSETSALAAEKVDTQAELRKVLLWFAAQSEARTRHECADALYSHLGSGAVGPACARINELVTFGCLEEVGRQGKRATLAITGRGLAKANCLARVA
jgi:hypothetical protein